ncbi:DMT family transporter [Pseudooceanicola sediminis]|uniref:DMT family transporter n=1 Tax=Pseudooceanicola sediminis TaxID=2211117 RepID=A0A399J445_9RHOB|nr:DMT family transporter [Pseudooceanicola sediminis]KAA2312886.1 DMT family transporter [Puniceibacterium sp. HSS470]RII37716.1 DMT family transporter [Pseudooceanicola sediminis]|tara:strand:+ start:7886 stop:8845 length:960 start_codon:yes stop_codon:yes gene_type:complete
MVGNTRGILFALLAYAVYSSHDVVVKLLGADYSSFQIVFFSVLFGFPLTSVMLMRDAKPGTLIPAHPWWMLLRTLFTVTANSSAFYAFSVLPLADAYSIFFATPLLITVISIPLLGEKVRLHRWMAVIVGLIGVGIVLNPGGASLNLGHLAALVAATAGAFASVIVRKIGRDERSVVMLLYPMMANFALMGLAMILLPSNYHPVAGMHMLGFATIAGLSILGMLCVIAAYTAGEAAIVAPMQYSQIIWATAFGYLLFDQLPGVNVIAGAGLIIASGLYIVLRESLAGRTSQQPVLRTRNRIGTPSAMRIGPLMRLRKSS